MKNEQPNFKSRKTGKPSYSRNWFDRFGLGVSLCSFVIILGCFRFTPGSIALTRAVESPSRVAGADLLLVRDYRTAGVSVDGSESGVSDSGQGDAGFSPSAGAGVPEERNSPLDLNRLAYAVSIAESSGCTSHAALTLNNCHGIMTWASRERQLKRFNSTAESFAAFKYIWNKSYGRFPDKELAWKWVCGGNAETCDDSVDWLKNVKLNY